MKKIILFYCVMLAATVAHAQRVSVGTAQSAAQKFFLKHTGQAATLERISFAGIQNIYIFNRSGADGFIIVAGDKNVRPVLAYSFDNTIDPENNPEAFSAWLQSYDMTCENPAVNSKNQNLWNNLLTYSASTPTLLGEGEYIEPLIPCNWNQTEPFNMYCPLNNQGQQAIAGCVAVAEAQIMRRWNFPKRALGFAGYYISDFGTLSTSFHTYDWDNMFDKLRKTTTEEQKQNVACLIEDIGISGFNKYGVEETSGGRHVLTTFFQYNPDSIHFEKKENYTSAQWNAMMLAELRKGRPIMYSGGTLNNGGHEFVVDGYKYNEDNGGGMFHFNLGWGGAANGYYYLDSVNFGFTSQSAHLGIEPDSNLVVSTTSIALPGEKNDTSFIVRSDFRSSDAVNISVDHSWLSLPQTTASGDGEYTEIPISASKNTTGETRFATITITHRGKTKKIYVSQYAPIYDAEQGWYGVLSSEKPYQLSYYAISNEQIVRPECFANFKAGQKIEKVSYQSFSTNDSIIIKIYEGPSIKLDDRISALGQTLYADSVCGALVYSQEYASSLSGTHIIDLTTPYTITDKPFWIGIYNNRASTALVYATDDNIIFDSVAESKTDEFKCLNDISFIGRSKQSLTSGVESRISYTDTENAITYYKKYSNKFCIGFYVSDGQTAYVDSIDNNSDIAVLFSSQTPRFTTEKYASLSSNEDMTLYPYIINYGPRNVTAANKIQTYLTAGNSILKSYVYQPDSLLSGEKEFIYRGERKRAFTIASEVFNDNLLYATFDVCISAELVDGTDLFQKNNSSCITVTRERPAFNLAVTSNNDSFGSVNVATEENAAGKAYLGEICTLVATARDGNRFAYWTSGEKIISADQKITFVARNDTSFVANFTDKDFTIYSIASDEKTGSVAGGGHYNSGEHVTVTATPAYGYEFANWTLDGTVLSTEASYTFIASASAALTANFAPRTFTVRFSDDDDGGTLVGAGNYKYGDTVTVSANPYAMYEFLGWYNSNYRKVSSEETYSFVLTQDTTLIGYFIGIPLTYSVIAGNGGTVSTTGGSSRYKNYVDITATPNSGYRFVNWTSGNKILSLSASFRFRMEQDTVITANFADTAGYVDVDYCVVSTSVLIGGSVSGVGVYLPGDTVNLVAVPDKGFKFISWKLGGKIVSTSEKYTFTASENANFIVNFEALPDNTVEIAATAGAGGSVSGAGTYLRGKAVSLIATPDKGFRFVNWTSKNLVVSTNAKFYFTANRNGDFTANFEAIPDSLMVTVAATAEHGLVSGAGKYQKGETVTLVATPDNGYRFVGWTANNAIVSVDASYSFSVSEDVNLIATFEAVPDNSVIVTATASAGGMVSGAGTYQKGETITLVATPDKGCKFVGWTANNDIVSVDASYSFTVSEDVNLIATFEAVPDNSVIVTATASASGTVSGAGTYQKGETVTLVATPDKGYKFVGWTANNSVVSTSAEYSFTVEEAITIVANFMVDNDNTAIEETENKTFAIYPNPAATGFFVENAEGTVELFTLDGKRILATEVSGNAWISVVELKAGTYLVRCGAQVRTLVKK